MEKQNPEEDQDGWDAIRKDYAELADADNAELENLRAKLNAQMREEIEADFQSKKSKFFAEEREKRLANGADPADAEEHSTLTFEAGKIRAKLYCNALAEEEAEAVDRALIFAKDEMAQIWGLLMNETLDLVDGLREARRNLDSLAPLAKQREDVLKSCVAIHSALKKAEGAKNGFAQLSDRVKNAQRLLQDARKWKDAQGLTEEEGQVLNALWEDQILPKMRRQIREKHDPQNN